VFQSRLISQCRVFSGYQPCFIVNGTQRMWHV
jgi:hypothetical protein